MQSKIHETFKPNMLDGFTSKTTFNDPSPPYVIAQVARDRLADETMMILPDGYDKETLNKICWLSGEVEKNFGISYRQGCELRQIGAQILDLDDDFKIVPPLDFSEIQSIRRLIQVVDATSAVIANRQ
jgi:hypothetical protein